MGVSQWGSQEMDMTAIGGKHRKPKTPTQPQIVIQAAEGINQYAAFGVDQAGRAIVSWIGD
jgi:hypothetical protein